MTRKGAVAVTQPRRVAAISIAKRVAQERGVEIGHEVCALSLIKSKHNGIKVNVSVRLS